MSVLDKLYKLNKLHNIPEWKITNTVYEVVNGSVAYGANLSDKSDYDIYAVYIPLKNQLFPHVAGLLYGYDKYPELQTVQQHGIKVDNEEFDITLYPITTYFRLCAENNPNMLDSLFIPFDCVRKATQHIGMRIRENNNLFLSKQCYRKYVGYAYSQLGKIKVISASSDNKSLLDYYKNRQSVTSSRSELQEYKIDWKFAYHTVRLMLECEYILENNDLNLRANSALLKHVRQGGWTLQELIEWFADKESFLSKLYNKSELQPEPNYTAIRNLLLECIESVYGTLGDVIYQPITNAEKFMVELKAMLQKYESI